MFIEGVFIWSVGIYLSSCDYKSNLKALHVTLAGLKPFSNQTFLLQVRISYAFSD